MVDTFRGQDHIGVATHMGAMWPLFMDSYQPTRYVPWMAEIVGRDGCGRGVDDPHLLKYC